MNGGGPILVLNNKTTRESGRPVQKGNIKAATTIADVIRTCLGPRAMLKMLMDPMGGIVITNDGNAILREITVKHPAAKSMIEVSRAQDEEVGDGTTSVIILAGEVLRLAEPLVSENMHPTVIIKGFRQALDDLTSILKSQCSKPVNVDDDEEMKKVILSSLSSKLMGKYEDLAAKIAIKSVRTVFLKDNRRVEIDIKKYAKVEKVPGGSIEDSQVLNGVMINKDVTHGGMKRRIENPRILLLDCGLEYKKGESKTNIEMTATEDFQQILEQEEKEIKKMCEELIALKPDLIITEKGVSDLAQHYLMKAGITAIRRVRKTDNNRIARVCGATICNRPEELLEKDIGTQCGLFEVKKIGEEYFTYLVECKDPKACTILLRGPSKDIMNEVERNLQDAMNVARNIMLDPFLCPGGGATEMALSQALTEKGKNVQGIQLWPYQAIAQALEVIPRTLIQNCGANTIRTITKLRAKHAEQNEKLNTWGIDGENGDIVEMGVNKEIWDPLAVKSQTYKTAIETAMLMLRIDDIVSGVKKASDVAGGGPAPPPQEGPGAGGDQ